MAGAYVGMLMVLIAFATETRGVLSSRSMPYLVLMAVGEILLTVRASVTGEWPFAVLGAIWAAFAVWSILKPPSAGTSGARRDSVPSEVMRMALTEALGQLDPPVQPTTNRGGNNPIVVTPPEADVTRAFTLGLKDSVEKLYTNMEQRDVAPATRLETHSGVFSNRSYDASFGTTGNVLPDHAIEMKVLPSENSGGWQTLRGFIGAAFVTAVDAHYNQSTVHHAVLVLPTSEFNRNIPSMNRLRGSVGSELTLILNPSTASNESENFDAAYDAQSKTITPTYRGHIGAMFAKFPSHASSYVGLYERQGTIRATWGVCAIQGGSYTAVVYSATSLFYSLPNGMTLSSWWP